MLKSQLSDTLIMLSNLTFHKCPEYENIIQDLNTDCQNLQLSNGRLRFVLCHIFCSFLFVMVCQTVEKGKHFYLWLLLLVISAKQTTQIQWHDAITILSSSYILESGGWKCKVGWHFCGLQYLGPLRSPRCLWMN